MPLGCKRAFVDGGNASDETARVVFKASQIRLVWSIRNVYSLRQTQRGLPFVYGHDARLSEKSSVP